MTQRRGTWFLGACVLVVATDDVAFGQVSNENRADARAAYDGAALAFDRNDFVVAAREFARADALDPNDVALGQALDAAIRADSAALAMNLVERAHSRQTSDEVARRADEAAGTFANRVTKIVVHCDDCEAQIDDVSVARVSWVEPGAYVLEMQRGMRVDREQIHALAGATLDIEPPPIPPPQIIAPPPPLANYPSATSSTTEHSRKLSPWIFVAAAGVTTVAGGLTVASGVDTINVHRDFEAHPTTENHTDGTNAQMRTNVLLGVSIALAASTAAVGLLLVRWTHPNHVADVSFSIAPTSMGVGGHFE